MFSPKFVWKGNLQAHGDAGCHLQGAHVCARTECTHSSMRVCRARELNSSQCTLSSQHSPSWMG